MAAPADTSAAIAGTAAASGVSAAGMVAVGVVATAAVASSLLGPARVVGFAGGFDGAVPVDTAGCATAAGVGGLLADRSMGAGADPGGWDFPTARFPPNMTLPLWEKVNWVRKLSSMRLSVGMVVVMGRKSGRDSEMSD
jgi:hypothetical protein